MTYQSTWRQAMGAAKLGVGAAVVAGVMSVSGAAQAVTIDDKEFNSPLTDTFNVGSFSMGDVLIAQRGWDQEFANGFIDISYNFTLAAGLPTITTGSTNAPNPPVASTDFGIKLFTLTWLDEFNNPIASQLFTDGDGRLDIDAVLAATLANPGNYILQMTGQLLAKGGSYDMRVEAIPLPAGLVLFLSGLAGIGFLGRYKAKRREPVAA